MHTIKISTEIAQELLIALRDRRFSLQQEIIYTKFDVVAQIAKRQLERVEASITIVQTAIGE